MKKRIFSLLAALCLLAALTVPPARAASSLFPDIRDSETAAAVEALRLMGVLDGYSDGTFRPDGNLNRAQFCKMVIQATGSEKDLGRYAAMTVFPDVRPSHWAASYINLAARGRKIVAGYADGSFHPERDVTLGHAVTILLRLLGYKDEDIGGVWPDGYVAQASSTGLLDGVGSDGRASLTRGQAARLFRNLLRAETASGGEFYSLSEETTLTSLDGGAGKLVTPEKTYEMVYPHPSTTLTGSRGQVVLQNGKALTFLPAEAGGTTVPDGAVIVYSTGSTQGLSALAGNRNDYLLYKNGLPAAAGDLRSWDVATYVQATNAVLVCDTRVTAKYENCSPSPAAPSTIEILGGTEFRVLPTAVDALSKFKPGDILTFFLSADGQIAGAVKRTEVPGNAVAVKSGNGTALLCAGAEIPMACSLPSNVGPAARLGATDKGDITFIRLSSAVSGALDVRAQTLGSTALASNCRIYDIDGLTAADDLEQSVYPSTEVTGSRTNWKGEVDLVVLNGDPYAVTWYGRAVVQQDQEAVKDRDGNLPSDPDWIPTYRDSQPALSVETSQRTIGPLMLTVQVRTGDYVGVQLRRDGSGYSSVQVLRKLDRAAFSAWVGKSAVTVGGTTYSVPGNVQCRNADTKSWITLDQAMDYSAQADLYVLDGAVRIVEVRT